MSYYVAVQSLLRPSETLKVVLETSYEQSAESASPSDHLNVDRDSRKNKRVLAVVTHWDAQRQLEEGSVFIFRTLPSRSSASTPPLNVHRTFPILGAFSISMAQTRRGTLDLSKAASSVSPRSGFALTISGGENDQLGPLTLLTDDVQQLKDVIAECKRLKSVVDSIATPYRRSAYAWLAPYTSKRPPPVLSSQAPPDLRVTAQPLHTRLSPAGAGLPGDDVGDIGIVRDEWMRARARAECGKGRDHSGLRVRIGTFNVNGKVPSQDLAPWVQGQFGKSADGRLPPLRAVSPLSFREFTRTSPAAVETHNSPSLAPHPAAVTPEAKSYFPDDADPDVLVLGFQELDLSTEALLYSSSTTREDAWCTAVFAGLGEKGVLYEKLASKQLVGMLLLVIVKKSMLGRFGEVKTCAIGSGIMGVMGNKGATAIRVSYTPPSEPSTSPMPTSLTFVNAHLAAFDEMVDRRNADFHDLSKRLLFEQGVASDAVAGVEPGSNVFASDALFWMTDLNYRIDLSDSDIRDLLAISLVRENIGTLLRYDQLHNAIRTKKAFEIFKEAVITHLPTYRFSVGLLQDSLGYDRKRKPAWTDRILHVSDSLTPVTQLSYTSHPEITMSDHRPVSADFSVDITALDKTEYEAATRGLYNRVVDLQELNDIPKIRIASTTLDAGAVSYKRKLTRILEIENVGSIPCVFRFITLESNAPIHPDWMDVEPKVGLLLPGETASINITIYVDNDAAARLNLTSPKMDTTLILHTALGKDHFISITGHYQYTCFANSISRLTRLPGPIRGWQPGQALLKEEQAANAPREIMRLVNWLMSHADDAADGLFVAPAREELVGAVRECLDTGAELEFAPDVAHGEVLVAFGEALLELLDSLLEPIVPYALHQRCTMVGSRDEAFELLEEFPGPSVNVWISVTAFLHFIVQQSERDVNPSEQDGGKSRAEQLAALFAPVLLREEGHSATAVSPVRKRAFLLYFIWTPEN
ncbi:hypothetical protein PLICRDRAFT_514320 [Plicaturopsis crispa FD-325 SS-3]|nr:hypothetical protein PLICRDRAFT_514320 [Plicaturopsis crispa FD-325 SS-3]